MSIAPTTPEEGTLSGSEVRPEKSKSSPLRVLWHICCYVFFIAALAVACATIVIPKVAGAIPMTILSNSMAPTMPAGSLAVVRPTMDVASTTDIATLSPEQIAPLNNVRDLATGDVIAFQPEAGDGTLIVHRIISVSVRVDGSREFTTKGDNNKSSEVVQDYMVRGKVWYHLPYLGYVNNYLNGDSSPRHVIVIGLAVALYLWAIVLIYQAFTTRRR